MNTRTQCALPFHNRFETLEREREREREREKERERDIDPLRREIERTGECIK